MARYANVIRTGLSSQEAQGVISQYLEGEGFRHISERGEMVWRKGEGWFANPQFIKAEPASDGAVTVEAWTAGIALLPGVYGGELNPMKGVYGAAIKAALRPRVQELERRLGGMPSVAASATGHAAGGETPQIAAGWYADPAKRHELRYWDGAQWTEHVSDGGKSGVDPLSAMRA